MKELETRFVEQQKTIEEYKDRMKEIKDLAEGYRSNSEKLAEQSEALREDLSRSRGDLAQMVEKMKSSAIATENQLSSKRDFTSKRITIITIVITMACGTILGLSYFISHNNRQAQAQTQTSISRVENSTGTNMNSASTNSSYEATPTIELKAGKDVVISIDGKTTKAEVISIDGEKAVVKTPDGNQYKAQTHLSDDN